MRQPPKADNLTHRLCAYAACLLVQVIITKIFLRFKCGRGDRMQLKKTELALIGLTIAFTCFILGFFSGQKSVKGTFDVKSRLEAPASPAVVESSASPPASAVVENGITAVSAPPASESPSSQPASPSPQAADTGERYAYKHQHSGRGQAHGSARHRRGACGQDH